jgi:hypothetical protein
MGNKTTIENGHFVEAAISRQYGDEVKVISVTTVSE